MDPVEGLFDNFIVNLLKEALDLSKIDKAKLKSAVSTAVDAMKPATKLPADIDDKAWDMLADAMHKLIDKIGVQDAGPLVVGASEKYVESTRDFSDAEVEGFLASCNCSEERKERVRGSKRIMKTLYATDAATGAEVFTDDERQRIVVGFPWLMILSLLGSLLIDLIKWWLSKN